MSNHQNQAQLKQTQSTQPSLDVKLSEQSWQIISQSPSFNQLKRPINSTIGYSEELKSLRQVTRYEHSIHAAKQAHLLKNANLSEHEIQCLELALLLHDVGHVLGSHSIDKLFGSLSDAPKLDTYGNSGYDFHEYHTAKLVASDEIKSLFSSSTLHANVMAILTYEDERSISDKARYYGFSNNVTLSDSKLKILYTLKDWLDRVSYLELEYSAINFRQDIKDDAITKLNRFRDAVEIHDQVLAIRQNRREPTAFLMSEVQSDQSPAYDIITLREALFEETVYHCLSSAYDEVVSRGTHANFTYDSLHSELFQSSSRNYMRIFKPQTYQILSNQAVVSLTQELTPIITLDHWFLTEIGINAFRKTKPGEHSNLIQNVVENKLNSSFAELLIHAELSDVLKSHRLLVITSGRTQKTFGYNSIDSSGVVHTESCTVNSASKPTTIVALYAYNPQESLVAVLKERIKNIFIRRGWTHPELNFSRLYDENIFKKRYRQDKFV